MIDSYRLPSPFEGVPVEFRPLSVDPATLTFVYEGIWADDRTVVFTSDLWSFAIHGVSLVEVDVAPGVHADVVEAMFYGMVMRCLFRHAGVFSLHASLLQFGEGSSQRTVAVAGSSGAGKSTTVSYTAKVHGGRVLVDDVVPVTVTDRVATAHPFSRPVHLVPDAAIRLGFDPSGVSDLPSEGIGKLVVDLATDLAAPTRPVTIDHLVILSLGDADSVDSLVVRPVRGAERLRRVVHHSNVTGIASFGARADAYMGWVTDLASCVAMSEVIRRPGADTLDAVARFVATEAMPAA